ncbi:hypothetical protein [Spirosoma flavum]|uniref:CPBP family intramembrane metalloprotease n=1 Tax=Spirosoma flavum TaxID=2048557 RepID=A0ABW6AMU7_9BACT
MKDVFKGFIAFLRGTSFSCQKTNLTPWSKSIFTIRALLVLLAIKLGIGLLSLILVKAHIIDYIVNNDSLRNWLAQTSTLDFLIEVILIGPLLEEFAFRGILQKDLQVVWIGFSSLLYIMISNGLRIDYY